MDLYNIHRELESRANFNSEGGLEDTPENRDILDVIASSIFDEEYKLNMVGDRGPSYRLAIDRIANIIDTGQNEEDFNDYVRIVQFVLSDAGDRLTGAATTRVSSIHA